MLYCFYFSDTEAFEACFRLLHDDDDEVVLLIYSIYRLFTYALNHLAIFVVVSVLKCIVA